MGNQQPRLFVLAISTTGGVAILIENQLIKLRVNKTSLQHYIDRGYSAKVNQTIVVRVEDLTERSEKRVKVKCDYCGEIIEKTYSKYTKQREIVQKDACFDCFPIKQKEVTLAKYGVESTLQLEEVKDKSKQSLMSRYGVDNGMKDKAIQERFKKTMLKRHGVEYAQQSTAIQETTRESNIIKFGVSHPMYLSSIRKKVANTEFVNGVRVSKGQCALAEGLDGSLNTNIKGHFIDIVLIDDNIAIEYDGSGHDLSVKMNKITRKDFEEKEFSRMQDILNSGWKYFIVKNEKDKNIDDCIIMGIKNKIKNILQSNDDVGIYIIS